ncbi:MAG TPA: hypothetical protein VNW15_14355 [Rhizomicrobium sp.]|nr:hypothetical protein [Rhizomicrobium sp.]
MSGNTSLSIGGQPALDEARPIYFFDFAPVLARSQALRRNPERVQLMCEHCVRRLAPSDIMLAESSGFFLIVHSAEGNAAEALAHEINIALLELLFGTDALSQSLGTICRRATPEEINSKRITIPPPARSAGRPSALEKIEADPLARLAKNGLPGYDGLTTGFVPLLDLRRGTNSLFLCGPVRKLKNKTLFGTPALAQINPKDWPSLDEAILDYSLGFVRSMPRQNPPPPSLPR